MPNLAALRAAIFCYLRKTKGVAHMCPPPPAVRGLAIVFMHALESMFLAAPRLQPSTYLRYIDDVFGVWTHGRDALMDYFKFLNTIHPTIKFTIEHTGDTGFLVFLDTKISISETRTYTSELYVKPMASPVIIHYRSALPIRTKKNAVHSQLLRAASLFPRAS